MSPSRIWSRRWWARSTTSRRLGAQPPGRPGARRASDGSLLLDGLTRLDEVEELSGLEVRQFLPDRVGTLGGLMVARLGRMPTVGDEVVLAGRTLRGEELDGRRIAAARLLPPPNLQDAKPPQQR